jgi:hypothetical protein
VRELVSMDDDPTLPTVTFRWVSVLFFIPTHFTTKQ